MTVTDFFERIETGKDAVLCCIGDSITYGLIHCTAEEYSLPLIDVHSLWMNHLIPGSEHFGQRDWLSDSKYDSCHPTPLGAEMTARYIFDSMVSLSKQGKEN